MRKDKLRGSIAIDSPVNGVKRVLPAYSMRCALHIFNRNTLNGTIFSDLAKNKAERSLCRDYYKIDYDILF